MIGGDRSTFTLDNSVLNIAKDRINEVEQSFALIAEIGPDVPDSFVCFQIEQDGECILNGRKGATLIRIVDDDSKNIKTNCIYIM